MPTYLFQGAGQGGDAVHPKQRAMIHDTAHGVTAGRGKYEQDQ